MSNKSLLETSFRRRVGAHWLKALYLHYNRKIGTGFSGKAMEKYIKSMNLPLEVESNAIREAKAFNFRDISRVIRRLNKMNTWIRSIFGA